MGGQGLPLAQQSLLVGITVTLWKNPPNTVQLVYKDHPRDLQDLLIHRWSLYAGSII